MFSEWAQSGVLQGPPFTPSSKRATPTVTSSSSRRRSWESDLLLWDPDRLHRPATIPPASFRRPWEVLRLASQSLQVQTQSFQMGLLLLQLWGGEVPGASHKRKMSHWAPELATGKSFNRSFPNPLFNIGRGVGAPVAPFNATGLIACSENSSILNDPKWPLIPVIFPPPRYPAALPKQGWFQELVCSVNSRQRCGRPRKSGSVPREGWEIDENATGLFTSLIWFQEIKRRNVDWSIPQMRCSFEGLGNQTWAHYWLSALGPSWPGSEYPSRGSCFSFCKPQREPTSHPTFQSIVHLGDEGLALGVHLPGT